MSLSAADQKKLLPLLEDLAKAVEELLLTGLTTASETTRQTLEVAFREASRMRMVRLSSSLRVAIEQIGRFTANSQTFSKQRLSFFLNRSWLLAHGMTHAIRQQNQAELERLLWTPADQPVERLEVVTIGVVKRLVPGAFCLFEFRLRTLEAGVVPAGQRLTWSCVFPLKPGVDIPPEGFLQLPQKQKFKAAAFLEGSTIEITNAALSLDDYGGGRISLTDNSQVATGLRFSDYSPFQNWDISSAISRIIAHQPSPLDLEVEMQEEVYLPQWQLGPEVDRRRDDQTVYQVTTGPVTLDAVISKGKEGEALLKNWKALSKKKTQDPLFGLLHYELGRLVLQPLTLFEASDIKHLLISYDKVDRAALLKSLKF